MSTLTSDDPTTREALGRLRRALGRLDPALRADLRRVAADPARVGAAGLTAGVYVTNPERPERRCACPITGVLLLRGETSWPDLARYDATCFDPLHDKPSWSGEVEDFNDALDALAHDAGWAVPGHGPRNPRQARHAAAALQALLGRLLDELEAAPARGGPGRHGEGGSS